MNQTPVRAVGIDPAARTGMILVNIPAGAWRHGEPIDPSRLELLDNETVSSVAKTTVMGATMTNAERDATMFPRLLNILRSWQPDMVVIEEPADQGFGSGRGVMFAIGKMYGIALAAVEACKTNINVDMVSYLVAGWNAKRNREARPGWMPKTKNKRGLWHTMEHDDVEAIFREAAARMTDRRRVKNRLSEHEIMAFGVLCFHLSRKD